MPTSTFAITAPAFFIRDKPTSSIAKPPRMKSTSAPATTTQTVSISYAFHHALRQRGFPGSAYVRAASQRPLGMGKGRATLPGAAPGRRAKRRHEDGSARSAGRPGAPGGRAHGRGYVRHQALVEDRGHHVELAGPVSWAAVSAISVRGGEGHRDVDLGRAAVEGAAPDARRGEARVDLVGDVGAGLWR